MSSFCCSSDRQDLQDTVPGHCACCMQGGDGGGSQAMMATQETGAQKMTSFCYSSGCRHAFLVNYFESKEDAPPVQTACS